MQYLSCGELQIPGVFLTSLSYSVAARTRKRPSGAVQARGREPVECSVQLSISRAACAAVGESYEFWLDYWQNFQLNRSTASDFLALGDFSIYPEMLFAPTNFHLSRGYDSKTAAPDSLGISLTFSACKMAPARALDFSAGDIPPVSVRGYPITNPFFGLIQGQTSVDMDIDIGDDFREGSRGGWLGALDEGGLLRVGDTEYSIYAAEYDGAFFHISGSIFTRDMMAARVQTYEDTSLAEIISDIYPRTVYHAPAVRVAYWLRDGLAVPEALAELQNDFGFFTAFRENTLHIYAPEKLEPASAFAFDEFMLDERTERPGGGFWTDGVNSAAENADAENAIRISSSARVDGPADALTALRMRLAYSRLMADEIQATRPPEAIRPGAMIGVQRGLDTTPGLVIDTETDYILGIQSFVIFLGDL